MTEIDTSAIDAAAAKAAESGGSVNVPDEIRLMNARLESEIAARKRAEALERILVNAVQQCYVTPPDLKIPPLPKTLGSGKALEIHLAHVSDLQGGKLTPTFNVATLAARMDRYAEKIEKIVSTRRGGARVEEIVIVFGGDLIEHESKHPAQWAQIEMSLFDQAMRVVPAILARFVIRMARTFLRIRVRYIPGNHGTVKKSPSHPRTNWDQVAAEVARLMVMGWEGNESKLGDRIDWPLSESWYVVEPIFDWGVLAVHGHQINGGFGGFPWYGTGRKANGWIDSISEPWDYLIFGHFHTPMMVVINHRIAMCNGTAEDGDPRVQAELAAAGVPCLRYYAFEAENGMISDQMVWLENRVPQSQRRIQQTRNPS